MNRFIKTITSGDNNIRNKSFEELCSGMSARDLIKNFKELDDFRKKTTNLYERVRACIFVYAGYRFFLMESAEVSDVGKVPIEGFDNLLKRNFEKAISTFLADLKRNGANSNIFSCLAESYHNLTFQILADQVRR